MKRHLLRCARRTSVMAGLAAMSLWVPAPGSTAEPQGAVGALAQARAALDRGDLDAARPAL
ncbi:MAG: hypothetical protein QG573_1659, partial [Acidobacteriota bacterium]|nr:hypothetical protein [Acidobacteriota bacterium]